jgi:hypothetical protein
MKPLLPIKILLVLLLSNAQVCFSQSQNGTIRYDWQQPNKVLLTGEQKPVITLGDSVVITLSGNVNLCPWEEEKKRGGFLGIGAKRYKEIHDNVLNSNDINTYVELSSTKYNSSGQNVNRSFIFSPALLNSEDQFSAIKKEYFLSAFIPSNCKNFALGWSHLNLSVTIETIGRIKYVTQSLEKEKPSSFAKIQSLIEVGNLVTQHPNELADALVKYYKQNDPTTLNNIKKDFYEYLLQKAPSNVSIRSELANTYIENLEFTGAKQQAKTVITQLEGLTEEELKDVSHKDDLFALATAYKTLANVSSLEDLGTQKNAYALAALYYGTAAKYFKYGNDAVDFDDMTLKQIKCLQNVGNTESLKSALAVLQQYVNQH